MMVHVYMLRSVVSDDIRIVIVSVAVVGLDQIFYNVSESIGAVEVCAVVISPDGSIDCPNDFQFSVFLSTEDDSASQ